MVHDTHRSRYRWSGFPVCSSECCGERARTSATIRASYTDLVDLPDNDQYWHQLVKQRLFLKAPSYTTEHIAASQTLPF